MVNGIVTGLEHSSLQQKIGTLQQRAVHAASQDDKQSLQLNMLSADTHLSPNALDAASPAQADLHSREMRYLQRELDRTHDMLVEGWVRVLHQRDTETAGHTRRVTALTLRLAKQLHVPKSMLVHIRRGALLHDIGKLWIPDAILRKPGPLTPDEWLIMRKHPIYARDLLAPIQALHPAIDIPYSHHERWDGGGYPCGLVGAEIPLAARIFAVVDVWDAIRSDRPYHRACSVEEARIQIAGLAGSHFDPYVVESFLKMVA